MARSYLDNIVAWHRARAAADERSWRTREVPDVLRPSLTHDLRLRRSDGIGVIAEIKRRSPSKGDLAPDLDERAMAAAYQAGGARAISVLTDEPHFGARPTDLPSVAGSVDLPLLRKDFTVSENDVLDVVELGASVVLLIVAALTDEELRRFTALAATVGLDSLVEVHDEAEAERAMALDVAMIGVNQRDLSTFAVDPDRAARVARLLPRDVVAVAESGFTTTAAVERAADVGFDAVLVGERFVTSDDVATTVSSFSGFPIGSRV